MFTTRKPFVKDLQVISRIELETIRAIAAVRGPRKPVNVEEISEQFQCSISTTWSRINKLLRPSPKKRLIRRVDVPGKTHLFVLTDLGRRQLEAMRGIPVEALKRPRGPSRILFDREVIRR